MSTAATVVVRARTEVGPIAGPVRPRRLQGDAGKAAVAASQGQTSDIPEPAAQELSEVPVLLAHQPPPNVAFLHVQPHAIDLDRWAFSLMGASSVADLSPTKPRARPRLVLADLAQEVNPATSRLPSQILAIIREFSRDNRDVPLWINKLRAAAEDDDLHLVIVDHTGFEIPWELLTLPQGNGRRETYLGAAVATVRWQDIIDDKTFADLPLEVAFEDHVGRIAAFVDVRELQGGGQEAGVLAELNAVIDSGLRQLEDRLSRPESGFGLVYVACHGQWAPSLLGLALGAASEDGDRLVLGLLQAKSLPFFERSKAIVFINSCHSGRMFREDEYLDTARLRGFPELFLSKGAAGVIGTTGWVNDRFATETAAWFLRTARTADEPVSKLLRRRRAEILEAMPDAPSEGDRVTLLNAFMYVYYGNPLSRLKLLENSP